MINMAVVSAAVIYMLLNNSTVIKEAFRRNWTSPFASPDSSPFRVLVTSLLISPRTISRYHLRKNQRNKLLVSKEALIGEHNLKPLLTGHKNALIGRVFWVIYKPVIA